MTETPEFSVTDKLRCLRSIDDRCDVFEKKLAAGETPDLSQYLENTTQEERAELIPELLALIRHYRSESVMRSHLKSYLEQHPDRSHTIIDILREETFRGAETSLQLVTKSRIPAQALAPGDNFGKFKILREVARGGMGVVFEAYQEDLNRNVALKVIISGQFASEEEVARFLREAKMVACLDHPNIVSIYEVDRVESLHYFTMNFFEGLNLDVWSKSEAVTLAEKIEIIIQLCEAIDWAHKQGIVHRDIKPANILVDTKGAVQVIDFGLAKQFDALRTAITGEQLVGTPLYMAPEQLLGKAEGFGPSSDIYAIGAVLYELLTCQKPFPAQTLFELMQQVEAETPVLPTGLNPNLPAEMDDICLTCLAKDPQERYASAKQIADVLRGLSVGHSLAVETAPRDRQSSTGFNRKKIIVGLGAMLLLGATVIFWALSNEKNNSTGLDGEGPILDSSTAESVDQIFRPLEGLPVYSASFGEQAKTQMGDVVSLTDKPKVYVKFDLTTSSFEFLGDLEINDFPTVAEAQANPSLITPELDSVIRGRFEIDCLITITDSQGELVETVEQTVAWNDGRGMFEREQWNPKKKGVDVSVTLFLCELSLKPDVSGPYLIKFEVLEPDLAGREIHGGRLLIY